MEGTWTAILACTVDGISGTIGRTVTTILEDGALSMLEVMVRTFSGTGIFCTSTDITCTCSGINGFCRATVKLLTGSAKGATTGISTCGCSITNGLDFALAASGTGAMMGLESS